MEKKEITLSDIVRIIVGRWYIIVAAMLVGMLAALYVHSAFIRPKYASKTVYYVNAGRYYETDNADLLDSQRIISFSRMIVGNHIDLLDTLDYTEMLAERIETLDLTTEYSSVDLYRAIRYDYDVENTEKQTYTVTVTVGNAADALAIAEVIQETASAYASNIDETLEGTLKIADHARFNPSPVNNRKALFMLLGMLLGFAASFAVLFIVDITDVRVKDEHDLTKAFDMPVIGTIPEYTKPGTGVHARV